jgi:hypothetical protein
MSAHFEFSLSSLARGKPCLSWTGFHASDHSVRAREWQPSLV